MKQPDGMAAEAFSAYIQGMFDAQISPERVGQTIGNAPASGGTHLEDGEIDGEPYCAATDISVKRPSRLDEDQILSVLNGLADNGFAAYYRNPGHDGWPATEVEHIHAVYAGLPMKRQLRDQIHDWLHGKNGLASHGPYTFFQPNEEQQQVVRALFLANNQMNG